MKSDIYLFYLPSLVLFITSFIPFIRNIRFNKNAIIAVDNNRSLNFIKYCVFFFCVFNAYGDWHHYRDEIVYLTSFTSTPEQYHLEDLYVWLITHVTGANYYLYRIIIWSISIFCLTSAYKRLKIDNVNTWTCFIVLCVAVSYAIGRGALGFSLIILGYSYCLRPGNKKFLSYFKGVVLLSLSLFCHKSMALLAPLTILSFIKLNIKRILGIAIFCFLMIETIRNYVIYRLITGEDVTGRAYLLAESTSSGTGIGYRLWEYSYYFIMATLMIFLFYRIYIKQQQIPTHIKRVFNLVVLLLFEYMTIYFAFTKQNIGNDDLPWRIFVMTNIPLPIVLSYFVSHRVPKMIFLIIMYAYIMSIYFILYNGYTCY